MKRGERNLFIGIGLSIILIMVFNSYRQSGVTAQDREIPFYTTADKDLQRNGGLLYKKLGCKSCHSLWTVRDIMRTVPAPALDGMGSLRSHEWLFAYFSAADPQSILPSRLKKEYQMPSFAHLAQSERQLLTDYISSLKVQDWYLEETRAAACRKITGEVC